MFVKHIQRGEHELFARFLCLGFGSSHEAVGGKCGMQTGAENGRILYIRSGMYVFREKTGVYIADTYNMHTCMYDAAVLFGVLVSIHKAGNDE